MCQSWKIPTYQIYILGACEWLQAPLVPFDLWGMWIVQRKYKVYPEDIRVHGVPYLKMVPNTEDQVRFGAWVWPAHEQWYRLHFSFFYLEGNLLEQLSIGSHSPKRYLFSNKRQMMYLFCMTPVRTGWSGLSSEVHQPVFFVCLF